MAASILRRALISLSAGDKFSLHHKCRTSFSLYFSTRPPLEPQTVIRFLIDNHRFSPDAAAQIASQTRLKTESNADSILSFLNQSGFSTVQQQKIATSWPKLLSAQLDTNIKPKFEIMRDIGFTSDEIVDIISNSSKVLSYSASRISSSITALKSVLGSMAAVSKFLASAGLYMRDMETTLLPNVELLKSCGVPMKQIIAQMKSPRFFLHKPEEMRKFVEKAERMGLDGKSGRFIHGVKVISSMREETWGVKMKAFRDLGFSDDDIIKAFNESPQVFSTSEEKMRRVGEVLVESGRYDAMCMVATAIVFLYSIEGRIRPRLNVLRVLEEKKVIGIGSWPSLAKMVTTTDAVFFVFRNLSRITWIMLVNCGGNTRRGEAPRKCRGCLEYNNAYCNKYSL